MTVAPSRATVRRRPAHDGASGPVQHRHRRAATERSHLHVDRRPAAPLSLDLTFTARTRALRAAAGDDEGGPRDHLGPEPHGAVGHLQRHRHPRRRRPTRSSDWWGQRDHSWGIRDHARCPLWMWLAIQLPEGMVAVWHWECPNGARVYTDGCFAPADGSEPIPVDRLPPRPAAGSTVTGKRVDYERDGDDVTGLAGHVDITLEGGRTIAIDAEGRWAQRYGPLGGGLARWRCAPPTGGRAPRSTRSPALTTTTSSPCPRAERPFRPTADRGRRVDLGPGSGANALAMSSVTNLPAVRAIARR